MEVVMVQEWKYREYEGRQGKFRVGDLVAISSYALTTEQNDSLLICNHKDMVGLIVEIGKSGGDKYPIRVDWINVKASISHIKPPTFFFFRELILKRT
jgi:hypothetical protein